MSCAFGDNFEIAKNVTYSLFKASFDEALECAETYLRPDPGGSLIPWLYALFLLLFHLPACVIRAVRWESAQYLALGLAVMGIALTLQAFGSTKLRAEEILVWMPLTLVLDVGAMMQMVVLIIEEHQGGVSDLWAAVKDACAGLQELLLFAVIPGRRKKQAGPPPVTEQSQRNSNQPIPERTRDTAVAESRTSYAPGNPGHDIEAQRQERHPNEYRLSLELPGQGSGEPLLSQAPIVPSRRASRSITAPESSLRNETHARSVNAPRSSIELQELNRTGVISSPTTTSQRRRTNEPSPYPSEIDADIEDQPLPTAHLPSRRNQKLSPRARARARARARSQRTYKDTALGHAFIAFFAFIFLLILMSLQLWGLWAAIRGRKHSSDLHVKWCSPTFRDFALAITTGDCTRYDVLESSSNGIGCIQIPAQQQEDWLLGTIICLAAALTCQFVDALLLRCTTKEDKCRGGVRMQRPWTTMFGGVGMLVVLIAFGVFNANRLPTAVTNTVWIYRKEPSATVGRVCRGRLRSPGLRGVIIGYTDGLFESWGAVYQGKVNAVRSVVKRFLK